MSLYVIFQEEWSKRHRRRTLGGVFFKTRTVKLTAPRAQAKLPGSERMKDETTRVHECVLSHGAVCAPKTTFSTSFFTSRSSKANTITARLSNCAPDARYRLLLVMEIEIECDFVSRKYMT